MDKNRKRSLEEGGFPKVQLGGRRERQLGEALSETTFLRSGSRIPRNFRGLGGRGRSPLGGFGQNRGGKGRPANLIPGIGQVIQGTSEGSRGLLFGNKYERGEEGGTVGGREGETKGSDRQLDLKGPPTKKKKKQTTPSSGGKQKIDSGHFKKKKRGRTLVESFCGFPLTGLG